MISLYGTLPVFQSMLCDSQPCLARFSVLVRMLWWHSSINFKCRHQFSHCTDAYMTPIETGIKVHVLSVRTCGKVAYPSSVGFRITTVTLETHLSCQMLSTSSMKTHS